MIDKYLNKLNVNPFWGGLIIQSFHAGYNNKDCSLLLHYIILPMVLYGDVRKGRRPNFMNALGGNEAKIFYDKFIESMKETGLKIETGIFGADMKVDIKNDGPVTILLDSSKNF